MNKKVIALVDWHWCGHHPNYFVHYAIAMAKNGCHVLPFCSDPEDFRCRLADVLNESGDDNLADYIIEPLKVEQPKRSKIRPARYRGVHNAWLRFVMLGKRLRSWEKTNGKKIDLVFFACIYDWAFEDFDKVEKYFGFQWSGLYLHARSFRIPASPDPYTNVLPRPERLFSSNLMRSASVLDEGAVEPMSKIAKGKPLVLMPDLTNEHIPSPAEETRQLVNKVISFAQGRPIVSLVGHLCWTKGLEEFTAAIKNSSMRDVFFFLGGELTWSTVDESKRDWMQRVWGCSENVYGHLHYISDSEINAVLSMSDIIYAAYRDFPNSSNILTKAALVRRPVIVSDGYLMAERVREYGLGEVVEEGNVDEIVKTLGLMLADDYKSKLADRARWDDYRSLHSADRLPDCFARLIGDVD